jgi:hypothetical protein
LSCNCGKFYRGDDYSAFGQQFLTVQAANIPEGFEVSKVEIKIGNLPVITRENPEFPLSINLTAEQSILLKDTNKIFMACYDQYGRKKTCEGCLEFNTKPKVV